MGNTRNRLAADTPSLATALRFLEDRVWSQLPPGASRPLTRAEEEKILGDGPDGAPL